MAELNQSEREEVFRRATSALTTRYTEQIKVGMTDEQLSAALKNCLGIFGGSGGPDRLSICHQGAGLKIWGAHSTLNHVLEQPSFSGKQTINMARDIYNIPDPNNNQMTLF